MKTYNITEEQNNSNDLLNLISYGRNKTSLFPDADRTAVNTISFTTDHFDIYYTNKSTSKNILDCTNEWLKDIPLSYLIEKQISIGIYNDEDRSIVTNLLDKILPNVYPYSVKYNSIKNDWNISNKITSIISASDLNAGTSASGNTASTSGTSSESIKDYILEYMDNGSIEVLSKWKNPKPNKKNTFDVFKDDLVLLDGKPLEKVKIVSADGNIILSNDESYFKEDVYPLQLINTEKAKAGDILVKGNTVYIVKKSIKVDTDTEVLRYTTPNANVVKPLPEVIKFACGKVLCKETEQEVVINDMSRVKVIDKKLTHDMYKIAKHYSLEEHVISPKEEEMLKELSITLDHPLNIQSKEWAMIVGESGSGKSTLAVDYANRKGVEYVKQQGTAQLTVDDFIGYKSITTGEYFRSLLRDAVEFGKIYILDEIDACNPNTLLVLNGLKQDYFQFPDKLVKIHDNFRFIATANTLNYSEDYNSRSPMDKATISRFNIIEYNMKEYELAIRYGLDYISKISTKNKVPREIEREVIKLRIKNEL